MLIDYKKIVSDIANGYDEIFANEFPEAKEAISILKQKPKCETCIVKNVPVLFNQPNFEEKVKIIYGEEDVEYDLTYKSSKLRYNRRNNPVKMSNILEFSEEEFKQWWNKNMSDPDDIEESKKQFSPMLNQYNSHYTHIVTYYNSDTKKVMVYLQYIGRG